MKERMTKNGSTRQLSVGLVNFHKWGGGLYLRSVPGYKVHVVCKMHQIKCAGILGWKMVAQLISRHGPDFVLFLFISLLFFSMKFCFIFFLQAETPPAAQKDTFYESLKKARRRRHFWVFGSSPKKWFHHSEDYVKIDATHLYKSKQNVFFHFVSLFPW